MAEENLGKDLLHVRMRINSTEPNNLINHAYEINAYEKVPQGDEGKLVIC